MLRSVSSFVLKKNEIIKNLANRFFNINSEGFKSLTIDIEKAILNHEHNKKTEAEINVRRLVRRVFHPVVHREEEFAFLL
jgi:hypothetical protein